MRNFGDPPESRNCDEYMHDIEPYWNWRQYYKSEQDDQSPFYGRQYSEFEFSHAVYDHYVHPQWDSIDSDTLYLKILFVDPEKHYAIIELIGEWNDAITNDIMLLYREVLTPLINQEIYQFVFLAENVLAFHADDDSYYQEIMEEISEYGGWLTVANVLPHVQEELDLHRLNRYVHYGDEVSIPNWRTMPPESVWMSVSVMRQRLLNRLNY